MLFLVFLTGSAGAVKQLHDCLVFSYGSGAWTLNLNDGSVTELCKGYNPQISPDGKWLATCGSDIFLYDLASMSKKKLTNFNFDLESDKGLIEYFWFSPDSKSIIYTLDGDIHLVKCDGSSNLLLTRLDEEAYSPCFSPQGNLIVYKIRGAICIMKPDGSNNRDSILQEKGEVLYSPLFSKNGKKILYGVTNSEGHDRVGEFDLDTLEKKIVKCNDSYPRIGTYSPDGKMILGVCDSAPFYMSRMGNGDSVHFLTDYPDWFNQPFYSVDGNTVEFIRDEAVGAKLNINILYNLLNVKKGVINGIMWDECVFSDVLSSPDGKWLALGLWYADDKHGNILLTTIDQSCQRFLIICTGVGSTGTPSFAPSLINGKLLDYYGNWHSLDE